MPRLNKNHVIPAIVIAIALVPVVSVILRDDSHHTNLSYRLWKLGLYDYKPEYLRFLNVDVDLRMNLVGEKLPEVKKLFPDLRSPEQVSGYQSHFTSEFGAEECYWIGDSNWLIEFEGGVVKEFRLMK